MKRGDTVRSRSEGWTARVAGYATFRGYTSIWLPGPIGPQTIPWPSDDLVREEPVMPNTPTTADGVELTPGLTIHYRATYAGIDHPHVEIRSDVVRFVGVACVTTERGSTLAFENCWASREAMEGADDQR